MGITNTIPPSRLIQPGVIDNTAARPASPFEGQCIFQKDTDQLLVWNGTAWVIPNQTTTNPEGLELVKAQTIGTSVSSVTVNDAFSATYDNYKIIYSGGSNSTSALLGLQLGATTSGYYTSYIYTDWSNTLTSLSSKTAANIDRFGRAGSSDITYGQGDLFGPFLTRHTRFVGQDMVTGDVGTFFALMPNTTSYTDFTLIPSSGLLTGGTIRVYGYRNS